MVEKLLHKISINKILPEVEFPSNPTLDVVRESWDEFADKLATFSGQALRAIRSRKSFHCLAHINIIQQIFNTTCTHRN